MTSAGRRLLGGRYELGDLLGYGGMAEVYLGRDVRLSRQVAVKVLRPDLARDPAFLGRFRREAQSAASLSHPSIVSVYDTGEDAGTTPPTPYIVMEYVQGPTLRDILRSEGPLEPRRAAEVTAEVCRALDYAHTQGLIHRDVKPGNVMLDRRNQVKVMDFGIARAATASSVTMTQTAAVIGTAQYLSPEQARGEHTDGRSDVYSVGCLLYELLTGRPPFTGDSPVAVAYQHVRENPVPPSQLDADLPRDVDTVVLKAMAKEPVLRYATAGEMARDLDLLAAGRRVSTAPVATPPEARTSVLGATSATTMIPRDPGGTTGSGRPDRRRAYLLLTMLVLALLAGAGVVAANLTGGSSTRTVTVKSYVGQSKSVAENYFAFLGLKVKEVGQHSTEPVDQVIAQDPETGVIAVGSTVTLTLSNGPDDVDVPGVVGFTEAQARQQVTDAGLQNGPAQYVSDPSKTPKTVVSASPTPSAKVPRNTVVTLTVIDDKTTVPDLSNLSLNDALQQLTAAGLTTGDVSATQPVSDPNLVGKVVGQSLKAGSSATRNTQIDLVFGVAAPTTAPPTPVTPTESLLPTGGAFPTDSASTTPSVTPTP